jgi:predicted metal-dependent hydrolase
MTPNCPADCTDPRLGEGIDLFNRGEYYACHDVLEAIWMEAETAEKPFYQGILQIAVGLYHLGNHNWQGASILLGEGVNRLRSFEPSHRGIDIEQLVDCGWGWLSALHQTGRDRVAEVAAAVPQARAAQQPLRLDGLPLPPLRIVCDGGEI